MHHHRHHCDGIAAMARRGFGWAPPGAPPGGDWGGFGDSFRLGRMLASGDLRLVVLHLVAEQPRHGYDLIKAIETRSGGIYVPSPGVIYPALTFLEEAGYATSSADGNKRLYTITDEGRNYLAENGAAVAAVFDQLSRLGAHFGRLKHAFSETEKGFREADRDVDGVVPELNVARRALKRALRFALAEADEARQRELADILTEAAEQIAKGRGADVDI